jgi:uncharacterized membrane protein
MLADEPGTRIASHSTGGDIDEAGEVIFENAPGGRGTLVTVLMEFRLCVLESAMATGEIPRSQSSPHGDRGVVGAAKRALYGETASTLPAK